MDDWRALRIGSDNQYQQGEVSQNSTRQRATNSCSDRIPSHRRMRCPSDRFHCICCRQDGLFRTFCAIGSSSLQELPWKPEIIAYSKSLRLLRVHTPPRHVPRDRCRVLLPPEKFEDPQLPSIHRESPLSPPPRRRRQPVH